MSDRTTRNKLKAPDMRTEYDFSVGVRGKYYKRYAANSNVVVLEPDVHKRFKNSSAVNKALREIIRAQDAKRGVLKRPRRAPK